MSATFRLRLLSAAGPMAYRSTVLLDKPVSYWRLDETAGTTAADQEGANPGTYTGGFTLNQAGALTGSGDNDASVLLDGSTGYVTVPFAAPLNGAVFSVEAWVNPSTVAAGAGTILATRPNADVGVWLGRSAASVLISVGTGTGFLQTTAAGVLTAGQWTHVVMTYDGATARLYINGALASTLAASPYAPNTAGILAIGRDSDASSNFWAGDLDEVSVYNYALSAQQVGDHYNAGSVPGPSLALDLSSYLRVNPDDPNPMDPYAPHFVEPAFADTPFSDGQVLISTTVQNREQMFGLFLKDPTQLKPQLHALIESINNAAARRPLVLEWRDDGASASTFYDVVFVRFEPSYNFRRSQRGYACGVLHVYTSGYGHTGTTRVTATAAGTGAFLQVPIPSVAGDAPALLQTVVTDGGIVPSLGRIVAVAPITNPSYTPRIPAASLTDLQGNATVIGASGADGSQYLALPISPTGGASGVACKVPLPNPTIAGGDNRILAVVKSGIDAGVGMYALDPFGNAMGGTAVASTSQGFSIVDLGVCRLPTVGYPTLPKIAVYAGGIWASGAAGPNVLASPAALALNEIFVLPDKNLALIYERGGGGSVLSRDNFAGNQPLPGQNDSLGNPWSAAYNNAHQGTGPFLTFATGCGMSETGVSLNSQEQGGTTALIDGDHLAGLLSDSMVLSGKVVFATPALGLEEVRLFKDVKPSQFVQARLAASAFMALECATGGAVGNLLASVAIATFTAYAKYRLALQVQGPGAFVTLSKDDGGPVFAPASMAQASIGVASNAAVAGPGVPAIAMAIPSSAGGLVVTQLSSWEVDTVGSSNLQPYDSYTLDGVNTDSWRTSSAGAFAGQKLIANQKGAFPKLSPSTTSVAVIAQAVDQGPANDLISAVVAVRERFSYAQ